eukprot:CAMPEP_0172469056 /NCGR_PEP_ID=MMETSP1065-20121228/62811_1 /TAXON_ID=265537 /ORGANISM="Amphiprora paludosa, Strain CCMP125" /LENGTH=62 /DNA_ID=CAMNT_0013226597 /DNA_START=110 /DNA_END=295 /DNA_ORIENTATION=-
MSEVKDSELQSLAQNGQELTLSTTKPGMDSHNQMYSTRFTSATDRLRDVETGTNEEPLSGVP